MDFIIDNWTDIHIETLIYQNEQFRYVAENISKLKENCNQKNIPVLDDKILSLIVNLININGCTIIHKTSCVNICIFYANIRIIA